MFASRGPMALMVAALAWPLAAQSVAASTYAASTSAGSAPTGTASVSGPLRPVLSQIAQTLNGLNVRRWKAPNDVRGAADRDISAIQRDLSGTLAGLLDQVDAAPGSIPAAFAVYRNVDALYDTLLRVVGTADLAAPENEAEALEAALKNLENARAELGDRILNGSQAEQAELVRLRTVITAAAAVQRAPVKTTVVDDGPVKRSEDKTREEREREAARRRHTTKKKPSSASPTSTTQQKSVPQ
jgi:hypothetical protein